MSTLAAIEAVDLRHLLAQIVLLGDQRHFDVIPSPVCAPPARHLGDSYEERLPKPPSTVTPMDFRSFRLRKTVLRRSAQHRARSLRASTHAFLT